MTTIPTGHSESWVPAACTLPTVEQPLRVAEFDVLFAASLRETRQKAGQGIEASLVLVGGPDLPERVRGLARAESTCCSFFNFETVVHAPGADATETTVELTIRVSSAHAAVLDALIARAEAVRQAPA